jgi:hypothetical protein
MGDVTLYCMVFFGLLAAVSLIAAAYGRSLEDISRWIESQ